MKNQPIVGLTGVAAVVAALLAVLANLGVPINDVQGSSLITLSVVLSPFILAFMRASHLVRVDSPITWPVFNAATASTIVAAILGTAVAFGAPISDALGNSILTFVAVAVPYAIGALAARSKVTPLSKLNHPV